MRTSATPAAYVGIRWLCELASSGALAAVSWARSSRELSSELSSDIRTVT